MIPSASYNEGSTWETITYRVRDHRASRHTRKVPLASKITMNKPSCSNSPIVATRPSPTFHSSLTGLLYTELVSCTLSHQNHDERPVYNALSHARVNRADSSQWNYGASHSQPSSCAAILRRLGLKCLWVNAICIDLKDTEERGEAGPRSRRTLTGIEDSSYRGLGSAVCR